MVTDVVTERFICHHKTNIFHHKTKIFHHKTNFFHHKTKTCTPRQKKHPNHSF